MIIFELFKWATTNSNSQKHVLDSLIFRARYDFFVRNKLNYLYIPVRISRAFQRLAKRNNRMRIARGTHIIVLVHFQVRTNEQRVADVTLLRQNRF